MTGHKHNNIVVFMIPNLDPRTGYLPPCVHNATWRDVIDRFGGNSHRARLMGGLLAACRNLAAAGCRELVLDGSFVTAKTLPADYDAVQSLAHLTGVLETPDGRSGGI